MREVDISIIIPVCNVEKYIRSCLDSILSQTLKTIEVICVDDASEDKSLEILREYQKKDERVQVITFKENMSASIARKRGVEASNGKYVMFVDSDDTIEPQCCEVLYGLMENEPVDILHFGTNIINSDNLPEQRIKNMENFVKPYIGELYGKDVFLACFQEKKYRFSLWNKIYKSELCKTAFKNIREEKLPKGQDKYAYFVIAYYAESYRGIEEHRFYNYKFGNGVTGHNYLSMDTFNRYCSMAKVAAAMCEFLKAEGTFELYKDAYRIAKDELLADCSNQWKNHLHDEEKAKGFDMMCTYWGTVDTVSGIAKCSWYEQAEVAQSIKGAKALTHINKKIKTIGVFYFRIENGGAQRVVVQLIKLWVEMGYNVVLFTDLEATERDYWIPECVNRIILPKSDDRTRDNYYERAQILKDSLEKYHIDLLVYHAWINGILLWDMLIAKLLGVPVVIHTHSIFSYLLRNCNPFFYKIPYVFSLSDGLVVLSRTDKSFWINFNNYVWQVVNPISYEIEQEERIEHSQINILWIGRVSPEKKPHDAIRIFKLVHDVIPNTHLLYVGDTPNMDYYNSIVDLSESLGVKDAIEFCGFQKDVGKYYAKADLHLMTSEYEGFPLTLLESKMGQIPCVMYDLPYLAVNDDKRGCFSVRQGDINGAAERIIELVSDADRLNREGIEAKKSLEWIRETDYSKMWTEIFDDIEKNEYKMKEDSIENIMWDTILEHYRIGSVSVTNRNNNNTNEIKQLRLENERIQNEKNMFEEKYNKVNNSYSYRFGLICTYIPRKIVRYLRSIIGGKNE